MNKPLNITIVSLFIATALSLSSVNPAQACSSNQSAATGLQHGGSVGSGGLTVCAAKSSTSDGTTTTITKTTVVTPTKAKPAVKPPAKPAAKPAAKPVSAAPKPTPQATPASCPTAAQLASAPRSADSLERWIASFCNKTQAVLKPLPKQTAKPTPAKPAKIKAKPKTVTETITITLPGSRSSAADQVRFVPNPLRAEYFPKRTLAVGQLATFSSDPKLHYLTQPVLGRSAQVEFSPLGVTWYFADQATLSGTELKFGFLEAGEYEVVAQVRYAVRYRLLGDTDWQQPVGVIELASNRLLVQVADYGTESLAGRALLVGQDCGGRSGAVGCS